MEGVEQGIHRHYTKKGERHGRNGGCQNSQGHREVDRNSAIDETDTHH